ncbi:MAG TPA: exodeoxyribonuclease VII large subunit, partial [Lentisphaeria bacterium]|nr:exodeoxyribonuclease VII large subunit [Lentisphaeria bacterium]
MAATPPGKIYGVSELTRHIKHVLGQAFPPFWLRGEISECRIHSNSSHVYFTLKDSGAQISAVFFRGGRIFQDLRLGPGVEVDVYGQLTVYEPNGNYQVLVSNINVHGLGDLHRRFEEMKQRLQAEGLFDPQRKRSIPPMPNCVGVITSRDGAALQDFLNVLHRRFA